MGKSLRRCKDRILKKVIKKGIKKAKHDNNKCIERGHGDSVREEYAVGR